MDWSKVTLDSLTVKNSVNKPYRGATVPYISYEAEDAATNGTLIGSSRKYLSMASEASGRQAVALKNTGDYLEFKLAESANSIVLRYSIPDSPDGAGAEETLTLYVDGVKKQLKLTSKYAWEYGSYPWSNDPRQGSGHRFFDEIHALIGDAPAGATIRLEKGTGDNAASYVIDLVDMEQVAPELARPDGFISVTDFGAGANDEEMIPQPSRQPLPKRMRQVKVCGSRRVPLMSVRVCWIWIPLKYVVPACGIQF